VAINQDFQQQDFFTRAPRDVSKDVVDWSEITGKFVDFINLERDRRMAAKAEIDKNISTTLANMDNLDVGMDVDFNNWMFEGANNARQYLLTQEKLLKSGQISVAQFKRNLSNTEGTITNFKNYTTQYNEAVTKREQMRMGVDGEGNPIDGGSILSRGDEWLTTLTGRYMDFGNTELVIGKDGTGGVVFTTGDPTMPYETRSLQTMGNLINMSQQMFTAYDYFSDVTGFVDEVGKATQGNIRLNTTSEKFNEAYQPAKTDFISSIVDSPSKLQSLASDHLQEDIFDKYTTDESKIDDPNALVFINQGGNLVPAMDSKGWQDVRAKAVTFLSDAIDVQTEEVTKFTQEPRDPEGRDKKDLAELYRQMEIAYSTGDQGAIQLAAQAAGFELGFDNSSGAPTGTVQGQSYPIDTPQGYRQWLLAAGQAASGNLSLAGEKFDSGGFGNAQMTPNAVSIMGIPPEKSGEESSSMPTGIDGFSIKPYGGTVAQISDYQNTPSELGYDIAFSSNKSSKDSASIEAKRKEILSQAYGQLAKQLGGTLEVNFDKASAEWTIKIGNKTISSLFDDRSNKASLDNIILEDYNEFLK